MVAAEQVALARVVARRKCARKVMTASGEMVNCGSRSFLTCPKCARVYRRDWQAILSDGVRGSGSGREVFLLVTLTAPSFGKVHRVPKPGRSVSRCACGRQHLERDRALRGVPVDPDSYDYAGQAAFNRDMGHLWRYTSIALRRALPDRFEVAAVREWQARGVLHMHCLVRVEGMSMPRASLVSLIEQTCAGVVAPSPIDEGRSWRWGRQSDVQVVGLDGGSARKAIAYLGKILGYVVKDLGVEAVENRSAEATAHVEALHTAARDDMACTAECAGRSCGHRRHRSLGAGSHSVSRSKEWSVLRRKTLKEHRRVWAREHLGDASCEGDSGVESMSFAEALAIHRKAFLTGVYGSGGSVP